MLLCSSPDCTLWFLVAVPETICTYIDISIGFWWWLETLSETGLPTFIQVPVFKLLLNSDIIQTSFVKKKCVLASQKVSFDFQIVTNFVQLSKLVVSDEKVHFVLAWKLWHNEQTDSYSIIKDKRSFKTSLTCGLTVNVVNQLENMGCTILIYCLDNQYFINFCFPIRFYFCLWYRLFLWCWDYISTVILE